MNDILIGDIKMANRKYAEYLSACDSIAKEAQKRIRWNEDEIGRHSLNSSHCIQSRMPSSA